MNVPTTTTTTLLGLSQHMPCHLLPFLGGSLKALPAHHHTYPLHLSLPSSSLHLLLLHHHHCCGRKWHLKKLSGKCRALSSQPQQPKDNYEFRDDKGEVELRIKLPEGRNDINASNVFVDAQDMSLSVALALPSSLLTIIPSARLYGRIKSSETVWFVDEEEIVISLKKLDKDLAWPSLVENWESLTEGVSNLLKGVPVYIVGDSSEINWAVTRQLAEGLQYCLPSY